MIGASGRRGVCRLAWLLLAAPVVAIAQTSEPAAVMAPLPSAAQSALDKGLAAARQQEWLVAIRYFDVARSAAPGSAVPLYNLGLAEAQLPGRELRAVAWFDAYLALDPNAANAAVVRKEMSDLEIRAEGEVAKLIEALKALASQMPPPDYYGPPGIAALLTKSGDVEAAEQFAQSQSNKDVRNYAEEGIVEALVRLNRIPDAIKRADQLPDEYRQTGFDAIFNAQLAAGAYSDAKIFAQRRPANYQLSEHLSLAEAAYKAGAHDDAASILSDARALIDKESLPDIRENQLASFAEAEYHTGRRDEAETLLGQVKDYAENYSGKDKNGHKMYVLVGLSESENRIDRRSEALGLMREALAARDAAKYAHEDEMGITGNAFFIWNGTLYGLRDYQGAQALLTHLYGDEPETQRRLVDDVAVMKAAALAEACQAVKDASLKALTDVGSSPARRAQAGAAYIKGCLGAPLFTTDFKSTMAGIAGFNPQYNAKAQAIFAHTRQPADDLENAIIDIAQLEHR